MSSPHSSPVVWITGASAGIGAAAVRLFAEAGWNVVLTARRQDRLDAIAAEQRSRTPGVEILPLACDVTSDSSVAATATAIRDRFGALDALINNAGFGVYGRVDDTSIETFRENMDTNYLGVIRCTQAALPLLRAAASKTGRGRAAIVMVSSIVGRRAMPLLSSYSATKFALEALSESLRVELRDERISVSVINPGATETDFARSAKGERPSGFLAQGMSSEAVAKTILAAVRRPVRNRYLSVPGKAGVFMQWLAPRVLDWVLLRTLRKSEETSGKSEIRNSKSETNSKRTN